MSGEGRQLEEDVSIVCHNAPDDLFEIPVVALLGGFAEGAVPPPPGDARQNYRKGEQHTDHTDNDHDDHACLSAESERDEGISRITRQPVRRGFSIHTIRRTTSAKSRFRRTRDVAGGD